MSDLDDLAVANLREYIKINTVSTTTDYADCVKFLTNIACCVPLEVSVVNVMPNRPFIIMKWPGKVSCQKSIVLNSHMDVMPVFCECKWEHPPFEAFMDEDGKIFGRGAQDMKMQGMQYLEAIRRLKKDGVQLCRTIIVLFTPDEELGGQEGMKLFVQTPEFTNLNTGLWVDESRASACPRGFILFNGEKHRWCVKYHVTGSPGDAAMNIPNTAGEKLSKLLKLIYDFRTTQYEQAGKDACSTEVISINATVISGGKIYKEMPEEYVVTVDSTLPSGVDIEGWKNTLNEWCCLAGECVTLEEVVCEVLDKPTPLDESNVFYKPFVDTIRQM